VLKLTIDGSEVQVAVGTNLVEAAATIGIDIPTYCYHPGLSVVGQCRICFVEVEGAPRLVTACSTPVRDGMVVSTDTEKVREARAAVMEFLLANHPLDCPVCDQAGECYLQDYSVAHGLDTTHMVDVRRTFPGLERRLIGPHVVQNQNRCIHCTRCIRFTEEISETNDLTMKSRGNHSYIDTFDGAPFDNPWSACAADVCPVGALTVKEFRFRARVWHLEDTESICPGCSIGCNVKVGHLNREVHRFLPRYNAEVNGWWMCDYGRCLAQGIESATSRGPPCGGGCGRSPRRGRTRSSAAAIRQRWWLPQPTSAAGALLVRRCSPVTSASGGGSVAPDATPGQERPPAVDRQRRRPPQQCGCHAARPAAGRPRRARSLHGRRRAAAHSRRAGASLARVG
jgi:NADH dehydrogenase/NADH:ubiquinone oxidoreductase subunit G